MVTPVDACLSRALQEAETANRAGGDAERVRIGILSPFTPPGWAPAGELIVRGACLAVEYVREHGGLPGGRQFELLIENDQATAHQESMRRSAVGGMAKLAVVDEVLAVLGQFHLRTTPWVVELGERLGVPSFIQNGHSTVTAQKFRTLFRTYFSIADRVPMMVRFMAEHGARRIAIVATETIFGQQLADAIEPLAKSPEFGMEVLRFDFVQDAPVNLHDEMKQVKAWQPDFLVNLGVMAGQIPTAYAVALQAAEAGLRPRIPMMVSFPFPIRSTDWWGSLGEAGNVVVWPGLQFHPAWSGLTEIGRWFLTRYRTRYGAFPQDLALDAFTDLVIVAQALGQARTGGRDGLIEALESGTFDTWRGPVRFARGHAHWHHSPPPIVLWQYRRVGQTFEEAAIVHPDTLKTQGYPALGQN
jgi:branched-chain amino acid transport system substrate-binding protein